MAKLISKTYGDALFDLALEENLIDDFFRQAQMIQQIFLENEEFISLLNHPKLHRDEKMAVMKEVFAGRIAEELTNFLTLIVEKERQKEIISILEYFIAKVKEYKKIGVVKVTSAVELGQSERAAIEQKLVETTGYTSLEMEYTVDGSLIGGVTIRIGDKVIDSSIRHKLETFAKELSGIQLA